ncbi:sugar phosphate isomerase/epimerase family protein [Paenibacillus oryzisoli]|uniref:sugar phosphate isomerase/epimerase family protein n=1 Tax=Paenibacillus oryzisoli TaxID=1850517 RepID=UPI003D29937C
MRSFGWCSPIEDAGELRKRGFDYIECAVVSLSLENEREFAEKLPLFIESPLPVRAMNIFFPGDLKVVGPDVDDARIARYVEKAAEALHRIGVETVVLGSGKARHSPDGWEPARADEQFLGLLSRMADAFAGTGTVLAIEPLNRKETNLVMTIAEAVSFAEQVNRPEIRVLADFYHMQEEGDPLTSLVTYSKWLQHIHLADTGRLSPGTGVYPYADFTAALNQAGYAGMISAECTVKDKERELTASLDFMRRVFGR